ncbi:MAG: outer membrane beta-barrel protein [Bacteroidetes bacterium]|nr:outer membrane beta-barrel protein [Bacteroidota bacterium]
MHLTIIALLSAQSAYSQSFQPQIRLSFGGGMIISDFDISKGTPGVSLMGAANYQWSKNLRAGINLGYHKVVGSDDGTSDSNGGYSFNSRLFEAIGRFEYVFTFAEYPIRKWSQKLHPFIYSGAGILQAQSDLYHNSTGQKIDTGPEYKTVTPVLSGGAGIYIKINSLWFLCFEGGANLSSSESLESYSNEAFSSSKDMYYCLIVRLIWSEPLGFSRCFF